MQDLQTIAAQAWATTHAQCAHDPVQFGREVALVAQSCELTLNCDGDHEATAAVLALLSVRTGELQELTQFFELATRLSGTYFQTSQVGEKS